MSRGDYRIFVGVFPTGDLADRIQGLREQCDPVTARITAPHVTLAGTYWRTGPATPENEPSRIRSGPLIWCSVASARSSLRRASSTSR